MGQRYYVWTEETDEVRRVATRAEIAKEAQHIAREISGVGDISTVFYSTEQYGSKPGKPLLFETMIFPFAFLWGRYSTPEEARVGHAAAVAHYAAMSQQERDALMEDLELEEGDNT